MFPATPPYTNMVNALNILLKSITFVVVPFEAIGELATLLPLVAIIILSNNILIETVVLLRVLCVLYFYSREEKRRKKMILYKYTQSKSPMHTHRM